MTNKKFFTFIIGLVIAIAIAWWWRNDFSSLRILTVMVGYDTRHPDRCVFSFAFIFETSGFEKLNPYEHLWDYDLNTRFTNFSTPYKT